MNTSVEKASKKRKSLGGQNKTPAKAAKLDESVKSPKENKVVEANNVSINNAKSPKKQIKPENKVAKPENGVSPKLKKFKGTKSLEGKSDEKAENVQVKTQKKQKKSKNRNLGKKLYLLEKMQERAVSEGKEVVIKSLNEKIDSIISKSEMTKSAKRTLRNYKYILKEISGEEPTNKALPKPVQNKNKKQNEVKKAANTTAPAKAVKAKENKKQKPAPKVEEKKESEAKKNKKPVEKAEEEDDDESDDDDIETSFKDVKNAEFEDDSEMDAEEEESDDDEEMSGEDEEESEEEDEESDEEDEDGEEEEEDDEEEEKPVKKVEAKKVNENKSDKQQKQNENGQQSQKKSRYVLFIGNLAYDTTKDELKEHFKRVGDVVDVRIPCDKESNRPRGFAYVELSNEAAYQKALDLNGSQLKNRRIKVEYTQGGNKNGEDKKKQIKAKNFKLHAMRKQAGQKGSPNKGQNKGSPFKGKNKK